MFTHNTGCTELLFFQFPTIMGCFTLLFPPLPFWLLIPHSAMYPSFGWLEEILHGAISHVILPFVPLLTAQNCCVVVNLILATVSPVADLLQCLHDHKMLLL